jgi:hypothetical protein
MTAHPDNRSLRHEIITMGANRMSYRKLSDQALAAAAALGSSTSVPTIEF